MTKITRYIAGATIAGTALMGLSAFASDGHMGMDLKASAGTISSINGNTVTLNITDSSTLKVGDSISLFDQTTAQQNRPIVGKVGTVSNGSFTVNRKDGTTVTVNTSSSTTIKKDGKAASLSEIVSGAIVAVKGALNSATNTIAASSVNIFAKAGLHLGWFKHKSPNPSASQNSQ